MKNFQSKTVDQINICLDEVSRFTKRAKAWKSRLKKDLYWLNGSKEGGACKRASMDLTRELAKLRNLK